MFDYAGTENESALCSMEKRGDSHMDTSCNLYLRRKTSAGRQDIETAKRSAADDGRERMEKSLVGRGRVQTERQKKVKREPYDSDLKIPETRHGNYLGNHASIAIAFKRR